MESGWGGDRGEFQTVVITFSEPERNRMIFFLSACDALILTTEDRAGGGEEASRGGTS